MGGWRGGGREVWSGGGGWKGVLVFCLNRETDSRIINQQMDGKTETDKQKKDKWIEKHLDIHKQIDSPMYHGYYSYGTSAPRVMLLHNC